MPSFRLPKGTLIALVSLVVVAGVLLALPNFVTLSASMQTYSLLAAMVMAGLVLVLLSIGMMRGRAKVLNIGPEVEHIEGYNATPVVEIPELGSPEYHDDYQEDGDLDAPAAPAKPKKLTSAEKRALKQAQREEKARLKQEEKFRKAAEKQARLAAKRAGKVKVDETELDDESQYVKPSNEDIHVEQRVAPSMEPDHNPDWLADAYRDPNFAIPFGDEPITIVEEPVDNTAALIAEAAAKLLDELRAVEVDAAAERLSLRQQMDTLTEQMDAMTNRLAELTADFSTTRAAAAFVSLEHLTTTHTRYSGRIERLRDMLTARGQLDDVTAKLFELVLDETAADERIAEQAALAARPEPQESDEPVLEDDTASE